MCGVFLDRGALSLGLVETVSVGTRADGDLFYDIGGGSRAGWETRTEWLGKIGGGRFLASEFF